MRFYADCRYYKMTRPKNEIHIVHGDSAGGVVRLAANPRPGNLLVSLDALSYGPWKAFSSAPEWNSVRESYFNPIFSELCAVPLEGHEYDILLNTGKLKKADEIIIWIGTGLEEQLLLVWTVQLLRTVAVDVEKLRVIQFHKESAKGFEVLSVGDLNPHQLLAHPTPKSLSRDEINYVDRVWNALTTPRPDCLLTLLDDKQAPLDLLQHSLRSLLARFPDWVTGLNYWDNELLKYTRIKGPKAVQIIGHIVGEGMDSFDRLGDMLLYYRLRQLGSKRLKERAVVLGGNSPKMRDTEVRLSPFGEEILDGKINFIEINGIDEWICGIHLQSKTNDVWYRNNGTIFQDSGYMTKPEL